MRAPLGPQGKDSCGQVASYLTLAAKRSGGNLWHDRACTIQPFVETLKTPRLRRLLVSLAK